MKNFGCSFAFGSDLHDAGHFRGQHSLYVWPSLLAQHHGMTYQCHAFPGIGNLRIAEKVLMEARQDQSPNLYVINWTFMDRFDFDREGAFSGNWRTIRPTDTSATSDFYYKNLQSQHRDKLSNLIIMQSTLSMLMAHQHRVIMTCIDDLLFDQQYYATGAIDALQTQLRPHVTWFENQNFLAWSRQKNYEISKVWQRGGGHPLEQAHQAAFELINSYSLV